MSQLNIFCPVVPSASLDHRSAAKLVGSHSPASSRLGGWYCICSNPRLDLLIDTPGELPQRLSGIHPETGLRYTGEVLQTNFDHINQVRRDLWRYAEIGPHGELLAEDTREMALRWTYRWELHHLLRRCGLVVEAEYNDFGGSEPAYGKQLILLARAA